MMERWKKNVKLPGQSAALEISGVIIMKSVSRLSDVEGALEKVLKRYFMQVCGLVAIVKSFQNMKTDYEC